MQDSESTEIILSVIYTSSSSNAQFESCLKSLERQTIALKIELIVFESVSVNAHSTLHVQQVKADKLSCTSERRRMGLRQAQGIWIFFMKPDEQIEPDYFEKLLICAQQEQADIVMGDMRWRDGAVMFEYPLTRNNLYLLAQDEKRDAVLILLACEDGLSTDGKIFRRTLCLKGASALNDAGDAAFLCTLMSTQARVAYVPEAWDTQFHARNRKERVEYVTVLTERMLDVLAGIAAFGTEDALKRKVMTAAQMLPLLADILSAGEVRAQKEKLIMIGQRLRKLDLFKDLSDNAILKLYETMPFRPESKTAEKLIAWYKQSDVSNIDMLYDMQGFAPKVSIIIPVYNGKDYLKQAIDSALEQTYSNIEVIVINDGSSDDGATARIAQSYRQHLRYFEQENGGVSVALNKGIKEMTGTYFSWLSHDDIYAPYKIEDEVRCLSLLRDRETIVLEGMKGIDAYGKYYCTTHPRYCFHDFDLHEGLLAVIFKAVNACAMLIPRSYFERVGKFNPDLRTTQDYDMCFRLLRGKKIAICCQANVFSRSHPLQGSVKSGIHNESCDKLWIGVWRQLQNEEILAMAKNQELFLFNIYNYFNSCFPQYHGALEYLYHRIGNSNCDRIKHYKEPSYTICTSMAWKLTKPLRAVVYFRMCSQYIQGPEKTSTLLWRYLMRHEMERKSDEEILRYPMGRTFAGLWLIEKGIRKRLYAIQ